jgi:hypothetical protein
MSNAGSEELDTQFIRSISSSEPGHFTKKKGSQVGCPFSILICRSNYFLLALSSSSMISEKVSIGTAPLTIWPFTKKVGVDFTPIFSP